MAAQKSFLESLPPQLSAKTQLCIQCGHSLGYTAAMQENWTNILDIARSGRPPISDSERLSLVQQIQETETDIDRCQKELDRLRKLAEALEQQEQLLLSHRDRISSIISSPIRALPSEILVEIFSYLCISEEANRIWEKDVALPTLVISQVCIGWYKLVTSTPALWSSFNIGVVGEARREWQAAKIAILKLFLQRSHPSHINFNLDYGGVHCGEVFALIAPQVFKRWRRAQIIKIDSLLGQILLGSPLDSPNPNEDVISSARGFPELVYLGMHSDRNTTYYLPDCPKLRSLALCRLHLFRNPSSPCWNNVQHVELHILTPQNISQILESCPNVEVVSLKWLAQYTSSNGPLPCLVCSRLRMLRLTLDRQEAGPSGSLAPLLDSLTNPVLTHLQIIYEAKHEFWESNNVDGLPPSGDFSSLINSICSMLYRSLAGPPSVEGHARAQQKIISPYNMKSNTGVTHLLINSIPLSRRDVQDLFAALPHTTHFEYIENQYGQETVEWIIGGLLSRLTSLDDEPEGDAEAENGYGHCFLLPNLRKITLNIRAPDDAVIQLICSRWRPTLQSDGCQSEPEELATEPCVCLWWLIVKIQEPEREPEAFLSLKQICEHFYAEGMDIQIQ